MSGDKCMFFNCNLSRRTSKNSFYSFPNNEELAKKWILNSGKLFKNKYYHMILLRVTVLLIFILSNIGNMNLVSLSPKRLKKRYICANHFDTKMYNEPVGTIRRKLKKNAVPMEYSLGKICYI
jgi:hypothetical protein